MPVELHKVHTCVPASVQLELNFTKRGNVFTLLIMKLGLKCQTPDMRDGKIKIPMLYGNHAAKVLSQELPLK